jgi:hypothetical protein
MKKIVRLTESKLVELIRGIVSEQQVNKTPPNARAFNWDLYRKKSAAEDEARTNLINYGYEIEAGQTPNPRVEASLRAKLKAAEADLARYPAPEIPKVTTTKFMPPEIRHDEEVTKPEPDPEPEEAKKLNAYNQKLLGFKKRGLMSPEQFMLLYNRANPGRPIKTANDKIIPYSTTAPAPAPEPEPGLGPEVVPEPLQESIKRTLRMFNRIK